MRRLTTLAKQSCHTFPKRARAPTATVFVIQKCEGSQHVNYCCFWRWRGTFACSLGWYRRCAISLPNSSYTYAPWHGTASNFSLKPPPVRLGLTARLAPFPWTLAPRAQQLKMHTSFAESLPCIFKCTRKSKNSRAALFWAKVVRTCLRPVVMDSTGLHILIFLKVRLRPLRPRRLPLTPRHERSKKKHERTLQTLLEWT